MRLNVVLVPAKMTWLLQPLDSHVFSRLKYQYKRRQMLQRCSESWLPSDRSIGVRALCDATRQTVLHASHCQAMRADGLMGDNTALSSSLLRVIGAAFPMQAQPPGQEAFDMLVGQHRDPRVRTLSLRASMLLQAQQPNVQDEAAAGAAVRVPRAQPLPGNRRGQSAQQLGASQDGDNAQHNAGAASSSGAARRTRPGASF